jgi:hypothetical protein
MKKLINLFLILILLANTFIFVYPQTAKANFTPTASSDDNSGHDYFKDSAGIDKALYSANSGAVGYAIDPVIESKLSLDGFYLKNQQQRLNYLEGKNGKINDYAGNSTFLKAYTAIDNYVRANPVADENGVVELQTSDSQANLKSLNLALATYYELWTQFYYDAPATAFSSKCAWSPHDLDLLYGIMWPDLKANKPLKDFTDLPNVKTKPGELPQGEIQRLTIILKDPNMTQAIGQINQGKDLKDILNQIWIKGNQLLLIQAVVGTGVGLLELPNLIKGGWGILNALRDGSLVEGFGNVTQDLKAGFSFKGALAVEDLAEPGLGTTESYLFGSSSVSPNSKFTYIPVGTGTDYVTTTQIERVDQSINGLFNTETGSSLLKQRNLTVGQDLKRISFINISEIPKKYSSWNGDMFSPLSAGMNGKFLFTDDLLIQTTGNFYNTNHLFDYALWRANMDQLANPYGGIQLVLKISDGDKATVNAAEFLDNGISEFFTRKAMSEAMSNNISYVSYENNYDIASALNSMMQRRIQILNLTQMDEGGLNYNSLQSFWVNHVNVNSNGDWVNCGIAGLDSVFPDGKTGLMTFMNSLKVSNYQGAINYLNSLWR